MASIQIMGELRMLHDLNGAEHQPDDFDPKGCLWLGVVVSLSAIVAAAGVAAVWNAL